jgi:hypothetical protein
MALQQNLTVDQGSLFTWDFLLRTDQTLIFDLTNYNVRGQVRKTYDSTTALLNPTFEVSVALGRITMTILPEDTSEIVFSGEELECVYDIEIYDAGTDVKRIVEGTIIIRREVTR